MLGKTGGRFRVDGSGNVAVFTALSAMALIGVAAIAVDLGSLYVDRRHTQGIVDLAALAAASSPTNASLVASGTISRNNILLVTPLSVDTGIYSADPSVPADQRFKSSLPAAANAVRLRLTSASPLTGLGRFLTGKDRVTITTTATATSTGIASFAIGSRAAALDAGVLNQLLGSAVGGNLGLSVMDYQSLLNAKVDLFDFMSAAATRASIMGPSYESVLKASIKTGDALAALSDASRNSSSSNSTASWALSGIAGSATGASTVMLGSIIDLGPYASLPIGTRPRDTILLSAFDTLNATARLADGQNQAALALNLNVPGIASASMSVSVGERPVGSGWVAVGSQGATVHTAQTRLLMRLSVNGASPFLSISLPLYVEIAQATATLNQIQCGGSAAAPSVTLGVSTGLVDAWIGDVSNAQFINMSQPVSPPPAVLGQAGPLQLTGRAHVTASNLQPVHITFSQPDILSQTPKTVSTTTPISSLTGDLLGDLSLGIAAGGVNVTLPGEQQALASALGSLATPIDSTLASILAFLGVKIGQADVWVDGVRCDGAVLVN